MQLIVTVIFHCLINCAVMIVTLLQGLLDPEKDDPFELFVASTKIRYTYYKDTHKILGNTYGMCVLQACHCPLFRWH